MRILKRDVRRIVKLLSSAPGLEKTTDYAIIEFKGYHFLIDRFVPLPDKAKWVFASDRMPKGTIPLWNDFLKEYGRTHEI